MSFAKMVRELDKRMAAIGIQRDKLDDLISEASEILEHCDEAKDDLQRARDALSQLI